MRRNHKNVSGATRNELVEAAKRRVEAQSDELTRQFRVTMVYVEVSEDGRRIELHTDADGRQWVDAYSDEQLVPGIRAGNDVHVSAMLGRQLLNRLLPTVGVRLDRGSRHAVDVILPQVSPIAPPSNG